MENRVAYKKMCTTYLSSILHHTSKQNVDVQLGEGFLEVIIHSLDSQHLKKAEVTVHLFPVVESEGNQPDRQVRQYVVSELT